jgi:predicted  nucleic acid-binding Zn-ribbon protein
MRRRAIELLSGLANQGGAGQIDHVMKIKIAIIILAVACIGLAVALFAIKQQGEDQHAKDVSSISDLSNQVVNAKIQIDDLGQVNITLTNDLTLSRQQTLDISNSLAAANATLDQTKSKLSDAQGQITNLNTRVSTLNAQVADLNTQISDLEAQNKVLDDRANAVTNTIAQLNSLIETTENKLAIAETNGAFLQVELQKQMAQRAELEHQFNDLNEVRAQVKKLKDELYVARRLQLMKTDTSNKKGAELLIARTPPVTNAPVTNAPNYNLNVEVGSDGSVKVIPPLPGSQDNAAQAAARAALMNEMGTNAAVPAGAAH